MTSEETTAEFAQIITAERIRTHADEHQRAVDMLTRRLRVTPDMAAVIIARITTAPLTWNLAFYADTALKAIYQEARHDSQH